MDVELGVAGLPARVVELHTEEMPLFQRAHDAVVQDDLTRFADATHAEMVGLATEEDFRRAFPDCEVGAMPPFGNLYGVEVLVDEALTRDDEIAFEAGNHHEAIRMKYRDYAELVQPRVAEFGQKA